MFGERQVEVAGKPMPFLNFFKVFFFRIPETDYTEIYKETSLVTDTS